MIRPRHPNSRIAHADLIDGSGLFDAELYEIAANDIGSRRSAIIRYCIEATLTQSRQNDTMPSRRPVAGFNPNNYANIREFHAQTAANPVADFVRAGKPAGPWLHEIITPVSAGSDNSASLKAAVHGHFHYPELIDDFLNRLETQKASVDLYLTCNTETAADSLRQSALAHRHAKVSVKVVPNRGRDVGPFMDFLQHAPISQYDVIGHFHGKKSDHLATQKGASWREFLWENLIGSEHPMVDHILATFAQKPDLGLVFAEEPHLYGWAGNRGIAEEVAQRLNLSLPLPEAFDFPVGTMFWARPAALLKLNELQLTWEAYPEEPIGDDGTILHALERLIPLVVQNQGFAIATTRIPGLMR